GFKENNENAYDTITRFLMFINNKGRTLSDQQLDIELGKLYSRLFPQKNEEVATTFAGCLGELADFDHPIRDEGHCYTALAMFAGLLHFPDFREHLKARHAVMEENELGY